MNITMDNELTFSRHWTETPAEICVGSFTWNQHADPMYSVWPGHMTQQEEEHKDFPAVCVINIAK